MAANQRCMRESVTESGSRWMTALVGAICVALAGCGGGDGGNGTDVAPTITSQPASVSVNEGSDARFSVSVTGTSPMSYQWRRGSSDVPGANSATYTLSSVSVNDGVRVFRWW